MTSAPAEAPVPPTSPPDRPAGSVRRLGRHARDRTDDILDAAERLCERFGHRRTTLTDIAYEVGVSTNWMYRFFPSKGALLEAVCARLLAETFACAEREARACHTAPDRIVALYTTLMTRSELILSGRPRVHELIRQGTAEGWPHVRAHETALDSLLTDLVEEGQTAGEFDKDLSAADAAAAVRCAMLGFVHPAVLKTPVDEEHRFRSVARLVCAGLRAR